jgi:hypothetical protein
MNVNDKDFNIYLFSNASGELFPENTLTKFKNNIPTTLKLSHWNNWKIGLAEYGIDLNYVTLNTPKNKPTLIFFDTFGLIRSTSNYNDIVQKNYNLYGDWQEKYLVELFKDLFLPHFKLSNNIGISEIYIKPDFYSVFSLRLLLINKFQNANIKDFKNISGEFYIDYKYDEETFTFSHTFAKEWGIFIHDSLATALNFKEKLILTKIQDEIYYFVKLKYGETFIGNKTEYLSKIKPAFMNIHCNLIKPYPTSDEDSQIVLNHSIIDENKTYFFRYIKNIQFHSLNVTNLENIEIKITDQFNEQLPINFGQSTILKFKMIKTLKQSTPIFINSKKRLEFPNNENNNFAVKLSRILNFNPEKSSVAMTSISYPNTVKHVKTMYEKYNFIVQIPDILIDTTLSLPDKRIYFNMISGTFKNMQDFINQLNIKHPKLKEYIELEIFEINIVIKLKQQCIFGIPRILESFLGFSTLEYGNKFSRTEETFFISTNVEHPYLLDRPFNIFALQSKFLIVYCSIIKPSIAGDEYMKILKVIPIKSQSTNPYITIEFENEDYYELITSQIHIINIEIRSHDGDLIEFKNASDEININMLFKEE